MNVIRWLVSRYRSRHCKHEFLLSECRWSKWSSDRICPCRKCGRTYGAAIALWLPGIVIQDALPPAEHRL